MRTGWWGCQVLVPKSSPRMTRSGGNSTMKKAYLLALSLAAFLAIPAAAQTSSSSDAQQPQANQTQPTQQTQAQSADQSATGHEPLKYERHEGFWGHLNPFARKKYVNGRLDPIRAGVKERKDPREKKPKRT